MQISKQMVKYLLSYVTIGWFGDHEALAENTDDYAPYIADLRNVAERTNDLPWFKLGLEHLLTADDWDVRDYGAGEYAYSADEFRDLLYEIWSRLFPNERLVADDVSDVELVNMSSDEWAELKKSRAGG